MPQYKLTHLYLAFILWLKLLFCSHSCKVPQYKLTCLYFGTRLKCDIATLEHERCKKRSFVPSPINVQSFFCHPLQCLNDFKFPLEVQTLVFPRVFLFLSSNHFSHLSCSHVQVQTVPVGGSSTCWGNWKINKAGLRMTQQNIKQDQF